MLHGMIEFSAKPMNSKRTPQRVLFVCLGNICRSPAAEIVLRTLVEKANLTDRVEIDSAGTIGHHAGAPPDSRMKAALEQKGYQVTGSARQILNEDLKHFDLIVTMDESNLEQVRSMDPGKIYHEKIRPFVGFCKTHTDLRVADPYYGGQRGFEHVIGLLEDGCEGILDELR